MDSNRATSHYTKNPNAVNNKNSSEESGGGKLTRGRDGKSRRGKVMALYFWTSEDVTKWLRKYCGQLHAVYGPVFRQHEITGRTLTVMTDSKLQIMGITNQLHKEELMRQILLLKLKTESTELKLLDQNGKKVSKKVSSVSNNT